MSVPPRSEDAGAAAEDPSGRAVAEDPSAAAAAPGGEDPPAAAVAERPSAKPERPRHEPSKHPGVWYAGLAILLVAVAAMMLYLTRGLTFNLDEWIVVTERRGPGAPSLLAPHNEHLSVLIIGAFVALLKLGGLDALALFMVPLVALQLALGVLLFVIAKARVGVGVALGVVTFALLSGLAYENFLIPGQAGQMASIVAGVGAFYVLDRPPSKREDRLLCGLMIVALCSSGLGIPVLVGIAVELLLTREGRARLWVVAVPFVLYVLWYVSFGTNRAGFHDLALSSLWAWTALNHAAGALIGERQIEPGRDFLIVLLVVLAYRAFRVPRASRIRLAAIATILVTFYGLTAISRLGIAPPSSSRYLTVGLVFLLLMLVEAARGWKIRPWVPYVVLFLALSSFSKDSKIAFKDGRSLFLQRSERVRASLGAVELLGRDRVDPKLEVAPFAAPFLEAGHWFDTLDDLRGDPGDSPSELVRASADARGFADDTLIRAGGLAIRPAPARAACEEAWRGATGPVPAAGVRVEAPRFKALTLRARRFGEQWVVVGVLPVAPGRALELHPLADAAAEALRPAGDGRREGLPAVARRGGARREGARSRGARARPRGARPREGEAARGRGRAAEAARPRRSLLLDGLGDVVDLRRDDRRLRGTPRQRGGALQDDLRGRGDRARQLHAERRGRLAVVDRDRLQRRRRHAAEVEDARATDRAVGADQRLEDVRAPGERGHDRVRGRDVRAGRDRHARDAQQLVGGLVLGAGLANLLVRGLRRRGGRGLAVQDILDALRQLLGLDRAVLDVDVLDRAVLDLRRRDHGGGHGGAGTGRDESGDRDDECRAGPSKLHEESPPALNADLIRPLTLDHSDWTRRRHLICRPAPGRLDRRPGARAEASAGPGRIHTVD